MFLRDRQRAQGLRVQDLLVSGGGQRGRGRERQWRQHCRQQGYNSDTRILGGDPNTVVSHFLVCSFCVLVVIVSRFVHPCDQTGSLTTLFPDAPRFWSSAAPNRARVS